MPLPNLTVTISTRLYDLPGRAHNAAGRAALQEELLEHHRQRIPGHFRQTARAKYRYKPRSAIYKAIKRKLFHSVTDLVRTGKTERLVTMAGRVRIGGTITGSFRKSGAIRRMPGLVGHLIMRVPWSRGYRDPRDARKVRTEDMADEITAVTPQEEQNIAYGFGRRYVARMNHYASGNRRALIYGARK